MTDPGCKVYQDSGWDLRKLGASLAKIMHLVIEFTRYGNGESPQKGGKRRYTTAR